MKSKNIVQILSLIGSLVASTTSYAMVCKSSEGEESLYADWGHGYGWVTLSDQSTFEGALTSLRVNPSLVVFTIEATDGQTRLSILTAGDWSQDKPALLSRSAILHSNGKDDLLTCDID